tara:strand:+ start:401 stop:1162 length:762 start_codon:yes stop_codon:yes gene_type:complete
MRLNKNRYTKPFFWVLFMFFALSPSVIAADNQTIPLLVAESAGQGTTYSLNIKILLVLAVLTVLPALLMTMTAFTRIIIVMSILRQAIGMANVPSNQIVIGLSLIMTIYVMMPMLDKINNNCIQPYMAGSLSEQKALEDASVFFKQFMLKQTRKADLHLFASLAHSSVKDTDYPMHILMPAFITSELKTAFQIGFLIFLPFLVIDLVTASVLMSMGMMMLSPMIVALPFKLLFFILVDGWPLMITSLISSFRT